MTAPPFASAFPYDYSRIEQTIAAFIPAWRQQGFDGVVAIARGGLIPAVMIAAALDIPLHAVAYHRESRTVSWYSASRPVSGSRTLLVEDIAGRGHTLTDSLDFLHAHKIGVHTFTLAYDAQSRIIPEFGINIPPGYRAWFPWERESITDGFDATDNRPTEREYTYASWAIDLDGVLLADLPAHRYHDALDDTLAARDVLPPSRHLPDLDLDRVTIITGRPEQDRARTRQWLTRNGFHGPLVMRDPAVHGVEHTARHKSDALLQRRHTHFLESEVEQALEIAQRTRIARVFWWNGQHATLVHASRAAALKHA